MALTRPKSSNIVDSDYKQSCRVVVTTNITLAGGAPNVYDDINLVAGDRILVKTQDTASQNGIYTVLTLGTGSNGTWIRSFDANDGTRLTGGTQVAISEGPNAGKIYRLATPDPITIDVTNLTWFTTASSPGGGNTHVQFNNTGSLEGSSNFTFDKYTSRVYLNGNVDATNINISTTANMASLVVAGVTTTIGNIDASNINVSDTAHIENLTVTDTANINDLVVNGDLTVNGTTTTLNTETLDVEDKNITVAKGAIDGATANGAGITVDGAGATILYTSSTDSWNFNKQLIGQLTTSNLRATGGSVTDITGAASTFTATNFSTGNIVATGGSVTDITGAASTFTATNFSTGNAQITGGSLTGITGASSTFVATNFSTGNAQITGGSLTGITGFSTGNAQITGGSLTGITGAAATLQATNFSSGNISITGGNIILGAGTASTAPLQFSSGTNLTTALPGVMEYDGRVFYGTTQGTERGLMPAQQFYVLNANRGLATATTTQTLFNQTFKVTSNTRYYYEAVIHISKTNATANTLQYAIVVSSAVLAAHKYTVSSRWGAAITTVAAANEMSNRITTGFNTLVSVSAASAAAAATVNAVIQGVIDVTTGGTINPQIALSTNATTAPTLIAGSSWFMYPVGPISANTSVL